MSSGIVIKVQDSDRCPEELQVSQFGLIISVDQCELPKNHTGLHRCARGVWAEQKKIQSIIENEGRSL